MKCRLLAIAAVLMLLPGQAAAAQPVSEQIDAELLRQFGLSDPALVKKYFWTTRFASVCRHEQMLALGRYIYGEGACVLVYKEGQQAGLSASGAPFRATVKNGQVTVVENAHEGWPKEQMRYLFPWYLRWKVFGRGYTAISGRVFNCARTEAAKELGLPLKWPFNQ